MDKLNVLAHELRVVEQFDLVYRAVGGSRYMHGDRQAELARVIELRLINLRLDRAGTELPAPPHAERQQAFIGITAPVPGESFDRRLVGRLRIGEALRPAAGVARTDAGAGQCADISLRMRGAPHIVTPGVHEGHAGVD